MSAEAAVAAGSSCDADPTRKFRVIVSSVPGLGTLWFGGWMFTIGFADLSFWKGVLGLLIWPYFIGVLAH